MEFSYQVTSFQLAILGSIMTCIGTVFIHGLIVWKIIQARSADGVSHLPLLFNALSSMCQIAAMMAILSMDVFMAHQLTTGFLLGQLLMPMIAGGFVWAVLYYFSTDEKGQRFYNGRHNMTIGGMFFWFFVCLLVVFVFLHISLGIDLYAGWICGGLGMFFSGIAWIPQIYESIKTENPQNLSLPGIICDSIGMIFVALIQFISGAQILVAASNLIPIPMLFSIILIVFIRNRRRNEAVRQFDMDFGGDVELQELPEDEKIPENLKIFLLSPKNQEFLRNFLASQDNS